MDRVSLHEETVRMQEEMENAAATVEAGLRGYSVRQGVKEMDDATQVVQGSMRGHQVREMQQATAVIQGGLRGADERKHGARRRSATVNVGAIDFDALVDQESQESVEKRTRALVPPPSLRNSCCNSG